MNESIIEWGFLALAGLATLVQISPLKINPWSWIGKAINGDIMREVVAVRAAVDTMTEERGRDRAVTARYRILRFADEVKLGMKHSEEMFNQVLEDISTYDHYCSKNPDFPNAKAIVAEKIIRDTYEQSVLHNDFL